MTDRPIIFSGPMVRALLDGCKTQTRRLLSLRGYRDFSEFDPSDTAGYDWHFRRKDLCWCDITNDRLNELLPCAIGDRLYVREAFSYVGSVDPGWLLYREDGYEAECARHGFDKPYPPESEVTWKPSIHMPRKISRLTLTVTDVRVQRLQDISEEDAIAEGVHSRDDFHRLWDSLNTNRAPWASNPWIVAISFETVKGNIDE